MDRYTKTYEVIWADMDPNRHMRHSAYNDYAAQTRIAMFQDFGLSMEQVSRMGLGPILFREETKFLKEITLSEEITVSCQIQKMRKDGSRWSFLHEIYKREEIKAAEIVVDGAWLDIENRKLATPTKELQDLIHNFPRTADFKWVTKEDRADRD